MAAHLGEVIPSRGQVSGKEWIPLMLFQLLSMYHHCLDHLSDFLTSSRLPPWSRNAVFLMESHLKLNKLHIFNCSKLLKCQGFQCCKYMTLKQIGLFWLHIILLGHCSITHLCFMSFALKYCPLHYFEVTVSRSHMDRLLSRALHPHLLCLHPIRRHTSSNHLPGHLSR